MDPSQTLTKSQKKNLDSLKSWIKKHMRSIKLPQLLIEVDNDLHFTQEFMPSSQQFQRPVETLSALS